MVPTLGAPRHKTPTQTLNSAHLLSSTALKVIRSYESAGESAIQVIFYGTDSTVQHDLCKANFTLSRTMH